MIQNINDFEMYNFDSSAFNYIQDEVMKAIHSYIKGSFPQYYKLVEVLNWHFFLYVKEKEIRLILSPYGHQPSITSKIEWVIKSGVRFESHEDESWDPDYHGGPTYWHNDFYRTTDPIEIK